MNIGTLLKEKREKQNLSMNEVAKRSGVGQSGISEIEAGKRSPTLENLERIVTLGLGMTLSDFFSTEEPQYNPELIQLINSADSLTSEQIKILVEFLKTL